MSRGQQPASQPLSRPPASEITRNRNDSIVVGAVMGCWTRSAQALLLGASTIALMKAGAVPCAYAQGAPPPSAQPQSAQPSNASVTLDPVTVVATKTRERVSDTLAPVSTVRSTPVQAAPQAAPATTAGQTAPGPAGQLRSTTPVGPGLLQQLMPTRTSDIFFGMPGVWTQSRGDEPGTSINIRGLQDFGRVAVLIDGARQNFQRTGHNADGQFYLEPEMLAGVDVVRGPVANIYGSGAIGGVAAFRTKDIEDVVRAGERWGVLTTGMVGSNILKGMGSVFAGAHVTPDVDIFGGAVYRTQTNYRDGDGKEWPNTGFNVASGIGKLTIRPADGHEVKFTGLTYETSYINGQPTVTLPNTNSIYDTRVQNDIATARWRYSRPDDRLFDFDANVYWTRTVTDQQKIAAPTARSPAPSATSAGSASTPTASTSTIRRARTGATSATLSPMAAIPSRTRSTSSTRPAPATCSRRTGGASSPATSLSCGRTSRPGSKPSSRRATTPTSSMAAGSPAAASARRPRRPSA